MQLKLRIPKRFSTLVYAGLLSGVMTLIVSALSLVYAQGFAKDIWSVWLGGWVFSWVAAFPVVLVVAPVVGWFVERITFEECASE